MPGRGSLRLVIPVIALVAAGCQAPLGPRAQATPSPGSTSLDRRVTAADDRLFAGDYDGAEAAYRSLANQHVPGAASHLSTLLAYENRFQEAVAAAQQGVQLRADSDSLARLTRALDWSEEVDAAVAAGARAVAARPVTTLAHVFYSEALADAGRFDDAAAQLRTAEGLGGAAYVEAEIDREWANTYRGLGDPQSELNYTELAAKAQPGFPERQFDLVRWDYANQRTDKARSLTDQVMAAHPKNVRLLTDAADAALLGGDGDRASSLYRAVSSAQTDSVAGALGQAEVAIAVSRDFGTAHDVLVQALHANPGSADLYQFLRYLDLLVLKQDPAADLAAAGGQAPAAVATAQRAMLDQVNALRSSVGVPTVRDDTALDQAATAHAYYLLFNAAQQMAAGQTVASEDQALPAFVGAAPLDRDRHFGYAGTRATELVSNRFTPAGEVDGWADGVFHRYPLQDAESTAIGYGQVSVGPLAYDVVDVGAGSPGASGAVVYPAPNQSGVPAAFIDDEVPDPLPQNALPPTGYPITIQAGGSSTLSVSGKLLGPDGHQVATYTLQPGNPVAANQWALIPEQPLQAGAKYTVQVTGTLNGQDLTRQWSFTVAGR